MRRLPAWTLWLFLADLVAARLAKHPFFDEPESPEGDYLLGWASWSEYSSCSKTCGAGVQFQLRRCLDVRCSGPSSRHRICNTEVCGGRSRSDTEIECSLRNGPAANDTWLPAANSSTTVASACSLVCQSPTGVVRDFGSRLKDGTRCERGDGSTGACLHGKCQVLGCDAVIGSGARLDQCGVCGGDAKSCGRTIFVWKDTQQFSPCDKSCGPSYRVSVSVCINSLNDRVVPERLCADQKRPRPQVRECPHVVCPAHWLSSDWSECSVTCGGGSQHRAVFCVESVTQGNSTSRSESRKVDEHYCWKAQRPPTERVCSEQECPRWIIGTWDACSATCGTGVQRRSVECRQDGRLIDSINCRAIEFPITSKPCYNGAECDSYKELTAQNDVRSSVDRYRFVAESPFSQWNDARSSYSLQEEPARLLHGFSASGAHDKTKPKFYPGVWSECSTTCGPGVRSRTVECVAFQGITSNVIKLPDYECDGEPKPSLFQPCQTMPCVGHLASGSQHGHDNDVRAGAGFSSHAGRGSFRWDYGEWGPCSASCLGGRQKSTLKCIDAVRKISVPWSNCDAKQRPVDLWRDCNKDPCPPVWEVGPLGECSHACGGGIRTRKVRCIRQMAKTGGAESTLILPDAQCPEPKPFHQEPCGLHDCQATWRVGQWSVCSTSCGPGEQRRVVVCEKRTAGGNVQVFDPPDQCSTSERPPTVQLCDLGSCDGGASDTQQFAYDVQTPTGPAPLVRPFSDDANRPSKFDQSHPNHRKLTLNVGGLANLYEGTSIKVKCPVRGFDRSRIIWTKDGRQLFNSAHIKVSSNGALRIFHARMEDAGLYACFANGAKGNVTLTFKPRESDQRTSDTNRTKERPFEETNDVDEDALVDSLTPGDVDRQLLHKVRQSLERAGEYRFVQLLNALREPGHLKVEYQTGEWSPCSQVGCGKPDGAQVRLIKCRVALAETVAYVEDEVCEAYGVTRPPASKACHNPQCPEWEASDWSECSASRCVREQTALQRREVKCVFPNGTDTDFVQCSRRDRPKIKKECLNPNCTAEWRPSVWGKCSKQCGAGVEMRLLRCVWKGTRKAAGRNCDPSTRPAAVRQCLTPLPACSGAEEAGAAASSRVLNSPPQSNPSASSANPSLSSLDTMQQDEPEPFKSVPRNWRGWRLYEWRDSKLRRV